MSRIPDIGLHENQKFINECIIYGTKNFWDSFSQRKLKLSKTMVKKMKVATAESIIEIKYDKKFFHHVVVLCLSHSDVNFKECI